MNFRPLILSLLSISLVAIESKAEFTNFPDGTPVPQWFNDTSGIDIASLGKQYVITDFGAGTDSTVIQTSQIQSVIDLASSDGGGVIVIPKGTFLTGSLFFKPGTHLHLLKGAKLKGSDAITHYEIIKTRLEGQNIDYFAALINADRCDGFTITGEGIIDGNGHRFYDEFWLRRKVNRKCTNLEALRPRMIYLSNSSDVTVSGVTMQNSGFWTNHLYNCNRIKYLGVTILAPTEGYPKGPSTDAIDLDVCSDVLISNCHMNVNDDAVCLKGGKGTYVDTIPGNGAVNRVIIDRCSFGKTNAGVTFGSEAWDCSNVIMKDCVFDGTFHVVLFKMRPDTPQQYRNVLIDGASGTVRTGIEAGTWRQFFDKAERDPMPPSAVTNVTCRNLKLKCTKDFYKNSENPHYSLSGFTFTNVEAEDPNTSFDTSLIDGCVIDNVTLNGIRH